MKKATAFGDDSLSPLQCKKSLPVFGIDLGTTNSAISVISVGDAPTTIELVNGRMTMPSCVMLKDGAFIVGQEAYQNRGEENVMYSVKRLMQNPTARVVLRDNGKDYEFTPAEISAEILKGLVKQTGGMYGEVKDVIVTVPAYFDQNGVNATREACELAGLNLIGIANEPTAASLCYHLKPEEGGVKDVLVYDLGGGTFDVTLMRIEDSTGAEDDLESIYGIESDDTGNAGDKHSVVTLAISGDTHLGGDDIDNDLLQIVLHRLREKGIDTNKFTTRYLEQLKLRFEQYKKGDVNTQYMIDIDTVTTDGKVIQDSILITKDDFRQSAMVIFKKTKKIVDELLKNNDNQAKTIVLTGGSTKNPWIQRALMETYKGFQIDNALSPDLSVSQGAAIQGKVTKFGDSKIQIFDILPLTIGVLVENAKVNPFIKNGTPLPITKSMMFTTQYDDQTQMTINLMQGNSVDSAECVSLGKLTFEDIAPRPAGEANLNVIITIKADRLMTCRASVDGVEKEIQLDLAGEFTSKQRDETSNDKLFRRLLRAGNIMTSENQQRLQEMITSVQRGEGLYTIDDIKVFITQNRDGVIE